MIIYIISNVCLIINPIMEPSFDYHTSLQYIQSHRCNSTLDLSNRSIPIHLWKFIQQHIKNNSFFPPIKIIDLYNSNITRDDIDPSLSVTIHF